MQTPPQPVRQGPTNKVHRCCMAGHTQHAMEKGKPFSMLAIVYHIHHLLRGYTTDEITSNDTLLWQ